MAQAEVEIVYKANATSLEASVGKITQTNDELVKGAAATSKKVADEFKKIGGAAAAAFGGQQVKAALDQLNRESDKLTKNLKELEKEQVLLIASGNRVSKAYQENAKAQLILKNQISQVNAEQQQLNNTFEQTETKQKSLTGQLRALKQELSLLEQAGKDNTEEFEKLVIAAASLEDQIGDTRERVRVLSSDTFKFDAAVGATQALASGFEIAQGAAALFGEENQDLQ
jgi:chromosome segregation ATPase